MNNQHKVIVVLIFAFIFQVGYTQTISLSLQNIEIAELLKTLAHTLKKNIILSPAVTGVTSISVQSITTEKLFATILLNHGLGKIDMGNIWYITSQDELLKYADVQAKLKASAMQSKELKIKLWRIKYANASTLANLLHKGKFLSERGDLQVDKRTNSIVVHDLANKIFTIDKMIKLLDVPIPRVMIIARIAAIDQDFERDLGVNLEAKSSSNDDKSRPVASDKNSYSIAIAKLANGSLLDVKLAALEKAGHAELISTPALFTENQQAASIEAGEEVPYQEVSESGGTATVFKKAVLGLKVTPQVLPGHQVQLQLKINQDRPSGHLVLGVPTISTRQLSTHVLVKSGETVILGGIYETDESNAQHAIPFLQQIPILNLFMRRNTRFSKRELFIFVTPIIIANS